MFKPLEPKEFCERWVPKKLGKHPHQYGYRKACCQMLAELTDHQESTVNSWLSRSNKVPVVIKRYLRAVDLLWQLEEVLQKSQEDS
ncbi:MAG: hypothetical protein ACRDEA_10565 [Microcystaceae cyanobacterium]